MGGHFCSGGASPVIHGGRSSGGTTQSNYLFGGQVNGRKIRRVQCADTLELVKFYKEHYMVPFSKLVDYFAKRSLWDKNEELLSEAIPLATRTMGAFSKKKSLDDLADKNGIIYVEGTDKRITGRLGGFHIDTAVKAGINVEKPGAFLVTEEHSNILQVAFDGPTSFTIRLPMQYPEALRKSLRVFIPSDRRYKNGQVRQLENEFRLPLGERSNSGVDENNLPFNYRMPGFFTLGGYYLPVIGIICRYHVNVGDWAYSAVV